MRVRLNDALLSRLKPPENGAETEVYDDRMPGFSARVTRSGRIVFRLRYRTPEGQRRVRLGEWPGMPAAAARKAAEALRGRIAAGADPVAERRAAEAARRAKAAADSFTCRALIEQWRALALTGNAASYREHAPRYALMTLGRWADAPAAHLTKRDVVALLDEAAATRGPIAANRARAYCRAAWAWAAKRGAIEANPWADAPRPVSEKGRARERWLDDWELRLAWTCAETLGPLWSPFVRLLILTGQRRGEVAGMRWEELDLARGVWRIPAERTKNRRAHMLTLPPAALVILAEQPRLEGSPFVFWGPRGTAISGHQKPLERLIDAMALQEAREAAEGGRDARPIVPWVWHDLRRSVATGMQRLGVRLEVIEAVLNHVSGSRGGLVAVYQRHSYEPEKAAALAGWAGHLERLAAGAAEPAVADLAAARARRSA